MGLVAARRAVAWTRSALVGVRWTSGMRMVPSAAGVRVVGAGALMGLEWMRRLRSSVERAPLRDPVAIGWAELLGVKWSNHNQRKEQQGK